MPVFVENPAQFSKQRLKSDLISHNVESPPTESAKPLYLEVNMKRYMKRKNSPDFSSDEEEQVQNGNEEEEISGMVREDSDMVDLSSLTDDQLKCKLLQYGVKAGPIVASTRALYERKLHRMMAQHWQYSVTSKDDAGIYSDSEEEEGEEEESGSEQLGSGRVSHTDLSVTPSTIENRLSPQSKSTETERSCSQTPVANSAQWQLNTSRMNVSLYLTPECSPLQKQTTTMKPANKTVTDVLTEMFPDTAVTPTGITATKRRSIKGAAGRPVQFKYPETPLSPATLERQEIQKRLVPLWVQIVVFLLIAALLYLIYISMEEPFENPFGALVNSLCQEPSSNDLALVPNSQDTHT